MGDLHWLTDEQMERLRPLFSKSRGKPRGSRIKIMFGRLEDWRRDATRYNRCATVFFSAIALAAPVVL